MTAHEHVRRQRGRLTSAFRLSPAAFMLVLLLEALFLYLSGRSLWHTDLWGHLAYGRLIVEERALPATEPLMPLSEGMPFIDFAWLSQVLGFLAFRWQGIAAIQFLYAASITGTLAILAYRVMSRTDAIWPAFISVAACLWLEWQQFLIVRPQLAGVVCFLLLFALLTRKGSRSTPWLFVTFLFAVWSNLHGSFIAGLALLVAFGVGRGCDLLRRTGSVRAIYSDRLLRQFALLTVCALAGTLINPYGWGIYPEILRTADNPNLAALVEWSPLTISMRQGRAAAIIALVLLILFCTTPRRISFVEILLLLGLGADAVRTSRMIVWWSPVAAYYLALHAAAIAKRFRRVASARQSRDFSSPGWAMTALIIGCALCAKTPLGAELIGRRPPSSSESLSAETPSKAAVFLKRHPPAGQIFNTYEWGDYLLWAGPPGLKIFVASHAHLIPRPVWEDYLRVINVEPGWETIFTRYRVNTVVLEVSTQAALVDVLHKEHDWSLEYEDEIAVIFVRRVPV